MKNEGVLITTSPISSGSNSVVLQGQLVIKNAGEIKRKLLSIFNNSQNLEVIFKNVIKMDMAILQLLVALQKSAAASGKKLSLDFELTGYITSVLQNSGLEKILVTNVNRAADGLH